MTVDVPSAMRDESECYSVPDHQEIYLDEATRDTLIVEIVQHNPGAPDEVCRLYVSDLAQLNDASTSDFVCDQFFEGLEATPALLDGCNDPRLRETSRALTCSCVMNMPKDGRVCIRMLVIQLPVVEADVIISVKGQSWEGSVKEVFETLKETFRIHDSGLFFG